MRFVRRRGEPPAAPWDPEPIRAELFSADRLELHAEALAALGAAAGPPTERSLAPRTRDNARVLLQCYRVMTEVIREERTITPAAEWLVDNFHLVDDVLRALRNDLPRGFYRELLKLTDGPLAGYPRVLGLAWAFVAHTDSRFDPDTLRRFLRAFQRGALLTIGELWAVPTMLRLVLIENLRRLAEQMVASRTARARADALADELLGVGGRSVDPEAFRRLEWPALPPAFAVQLVQRLRDQDPARVPALSWLGAQLATAGRSSDELVRAEHQRQATMTVTVRNVITSIRMMSTFDWPEFVESVSRVDDRLRQDSAFGAMDFATRDRYRHAIEDLARGSGRSELDVTEAALACTRAAALRGGAAPDGEADRRLDPGYYLISEGRPALEAALGYRLPLRRRLLRAYVSTATASYVGTILLVACFLVAFPILHGYRSGMGLLPLALLGLVALIPMSDLAIALVNRAVMELLGPRRLPRMDLPAGVPEGLRTIVVVPTLLTSVEEIRDQIDRLEVHYLTNSEGQIWFALLSDWSDAPAETMPDDLPLLDAARRGLEAANRRHGADPDGGPRFFLLHRRRVWNAGEGRWIGWERKRGKLHELNRLLRGASDTTFVGLDGRPPALPAGIRYVITLDADTRLPRGAAAALVGTMAHPLNRPAYDARLGRVVDGHAVLQPRITPALPVGRSESLFQRIYSGPAGADPYALAISDVYQDLFNEGSYSGKGIYDVDAFQAALADRVPENTLLSHDLFEGVFARAALVTDVELFEEYPSRYEEAARRQHRWARGDWQLLPWIVGGRAAGRHPARIPLIGRWKMIDNLRRTLSRPAAWATLVGGWVLADATPVVWTRLVLVALAVPALVPASLELVPQRVGVSKRNHLRSVGRNLLLAGGQILLDVAFLAHQAWLMTDAIGRTLYRLAVTRRHLLEWITAAQSRAGLAGGPGGAYRRMVGAPILAGVAALLVGASRPESWMVALPFIALWAGSPALAWWVSRVSRIRPSEGLSEAETRLLRATARRTWRFFETFVGPEDHHLPPDNFQEDPKPVVAHRTSPTNIGLYLLSTLAAYDLGWLGTLDTVDRLEATFQGLGRLERFRGHFYNWYDTRRLQPLEPRYVSTVDSGNLAGHLLAVESACRQLLTRPLRNAEACRGVEDALALVREAAGRLADDRRTQTVSRDDLARAIDDLARGLADGDDGAPDHLRRLRTLADTLVDVAQTLAAERGDLVDSDVLDWARAVQATIASHVRDADVLLAWAPLLEDAGSPSPAGSEVQRRRLDTALTLADVPARSRATAAEPSAAGPAPIDAASGRADPLAPVPPEAADRAAAAADAVVRRVTAIRRQAREWFGAMRFDFLFDPTRKVFAIGYRVADGTLDAGAYDLLASEARLASFVAIAKGDVPTAHWFRLGRPMTPVGLGAALVSWSGSMFEYLMPTLVMQSPSGSLLDQTYRAVVGRQQRYGLEHGVPWGISESAHNVRDLDLTYQYSSFGVPGLGLERGLSEDLVVAPYATALAAMVDAPAAARNLSALAEAGARGRFGYYEALDYTRSRLPEGARVAVVRAYMSHHQGMTLLALANVLRDQVVRRWFHAQRIVQATELLLQERTPEDVVVARPRVEEVRAPAHVRDFVEPAFRQFTSVDDPLPRTHLLSNGRYAVMLTAAGSGYSRCDGLAITRWREDPTRDHWGTYVFLRDVESGQVWSATHQPVGVEADAYTATFFEDRAEFHRRDGTVTTTLEVVVSPEDNAELRRVSLTNFGAAAREIEITSYAEIALAPPAAEAAHPVFSNLFVQTESAPHLDALLATRRPRAPEEPTVYAAHVVSVEGQGSGGAQHETDRLRFLGRGRGIRTPMSVIDGRPLSNTVGSVLDPIFSLRRRVRLAPAGSARILFSTLVAPSHLEALALAEKYRDAAMFERTATLAWTRAQVQFHHLGSGPDEAHLFQHLASRILYSDPGLRAPADVLERNRTGPAALWAQGISGDLPIVLVRIDEPEDQGIVRQLLRAHEYWRLRGLAVDLVILNEKAHSYVQDLQTSLESLVRTSQATLRHEEHETHGNVFVLRADLLSAGDRDALRTAARAVLLSRHGTLTEQVARARRARAEPRRPPRRPPQVPAGPERPPPRPELEFFNGLGGFAEDGREYVTVLGTGQWTPAPWINVVANEHFGFQVSESGSGYTWSLNSRENQLTPWTNDPVCDSPGEVIYVRDDETGELWGPTVLPIREEAWPYVVRHGQGYSRFEHGSHGIALELLQYVPLEDPVKISRLTVENRSGQPRRLSVTAYVEWVLGSARSASAPFVVTERDEATGALLARNAWNVDFGDRVAFLALGAPATAWSGDRSEILGRHGTLDHPAALERGEPLSGRVGAGLDPCGALQTTLALPPGARAEVVVFLGQAATREAAVALVSRYRGTDPDRVLHAVKTRWDDVLSALQVKTPDRSFDLMLNRWLLYQTLACRVWARSAFYQAGGAYGFRDQLQDVMALAVARRDLARAHLLRAASRQFAEGDVQHWWHPPSGRGVRTRISDDLVWLPYAVVHFVEVTGDQAVLDEVVPFLEGPPLEPGQHEAYFQPTVSAQSGSLFEHCARALDRSLAVGPHGLPLIGTGDWNDGMNRVGREGRGESVWLGWFLHSTLWEFAKFADLRGERTRAERWRRHVRNLKDAIERHGWDGDWYRRAYFDDGTPLGSAANVECRIDSIAQSWGVLSGAAERSRAERAMAAVEEYLVRREQELVLLFTPPFDRADVDPGYVRGYPPGVRENGGQYTHAAVWAVAAFAALGDGDKAGELFSIFNSINRASTRAGVYRYKVEPYVVAADVYAELPHVGRGGWTWYTGSAGWMYRAGVEWLLGFRFRGATLYLDPCIPRAWRRFEIAFRYHSSRYLVIVENPLGVSRGVQVVSVDDAPAVPGETSVALVDDGGSHRVRAILG
jgi:cyclic beta-1,2-glucan synthetase